jgi:hypothetical protein
LSPSERTVYGIEWGVSQAVVDAAFLIAVKLHEGGYAKST